MADGIRIAAVAGSLRQGSYNKKLLAVAVREAELKGAEVDVLDLKSLDLPIYDGDVDAAGAPKSVVEAKERIARAQGLLIVSPEYNYSIPGGLKNLIDWVSRPPDMPLRNKAVALMGATTGLLGTVRGQMALRQCLSAFRLWLLPQSVMLSSAKDAFDEHGTLIDPKKKGEVDQLVSELVRVCAGGALLEARKE